MKRSDGPKLPRASPRSGMEKLGCYSSQAPLIVPGRETAVERPEFAPTKERNEYCVIIAWNTGPQAQIKPFACVEGAQRRTDRESEY
jgi:hypothetical protein